MAARAYGAYSGINEAIQLSEDKWPLSAHLASEYRQELVLMAILRAFAIMDRDSDVSYPTIYHFLKQTDALPSICYRLVEEGHYSRSSVVKVSFEAERAFLSRFEALDWSEIGQIQKFRNVALAHATHEEFRHQVTYGSLERLVRAQCEMCHQLDTLYGGSADTTIRHLEDAHANSSSFWQAVIKADAKDELEW